MPRLGPFSFDGGLNTRANSQTLPKNQLTAAVNVVYDYGALRKRSGSVRLNSSALSGTPAITGLTAFVLSGTHYIMTTAGADVFKMETLDGTWDSITGAITITGGQDKQHTFASLNNINAFANGTDVPHRWNGTGNAVDLGGSPPTGGILSTVNNYMFLSGISANPSRVYWCNPGDPETWASTSYLEFRRTDGDGVSGLVGIDTDLYIFKKRSIGRLVTTNISLDTLSLGPLLTVLTGIGCAGKLAITNIDNGTVAFLGSNAHVYVFDGEQLKDIGDQGSPNPSIQPTLDALNLARLQYAVMQYYATTRQIWLSVTSATASAHDTILVYDVEDNAWSTFSGIAANAMCSSIDPRGTQLKPTLLFTGNYGGYVIEQDRGTSDESSTAIDGYGVASIVISPETQEFIPKSILVPVGNDGDWSLEVNYGFNALTTVSTINTVNLGGGSALDSFVLDSDSLGDDSELFRAILIKTAGRVRTMQVQFRNRNASQPFRVYPFYISDEVMV